MPRSPRLVAAALAAALGALPPSSTPARAGQDAAAAASPPAAPAAVALATVRFVDVARESGITLMNASGEADKEYIVEAHGAGVAWFDYDGDGDVDLFLANGSRLRGYPAGHEPSDALYRNDRGRFTDVTAAAGMRERAWSFGVAAADYDNDGRTDLYVTAWGRNTLYRNRGDGTFEDATERAGVGDRRWGTSAAFADYDRDGWVDLYVANYVDFELGAVPGRGASPTCRWRGLDVYCGPRGLPAAPDVLYHNNRDGTFSDVSAGAGVALEQPLYGLGVSWADYDNDGDPDLYVANDSTPSLLFRNNGDGTFTEVATAAGCAYSGDGREQAGMGVDWEDYDGDGWLDLFKSNFSHDYYTLYHNEAGVRFSDATFRAALAEPTLRYLGWSTRFLDYDNDGWSDLFVANGHVYPEVEKEPVGTDYKQRSQLFRNRGDGTFAEATAEAGPAFAVAHLSRGAASADYDDDGDVDLAMTHLHEIPGLWRNDGGNQAGHWLSLRLRATAGNPDAIGARVEVTAEGRRRIDEVRSGSGYLSQSDFRLHFGLGKASAAAVKVRWPDGTVAELGSLAADRFWLLEEGKPPRETPKPARPGARP
jgi:hypothetical protein